MHIYIYIILYISYQYIPTNSYKCIQKNSIKQWDNHALWTCPAVRHCASTPAGTEVLRHPRRSSPGPVGKPNAPDVG